MRKINKKLNKNVPKHKTKGIHEESLTFLMKKWKNCENMLDQLTRAVLCV